MTTSNQKNRDEIQWGGFKELSIIVSFIILAGFIVKIPTLLGLEQDLFLQRNISFVVFPFLIAYTAFKNEYSIKKLFFPVIVIAISATYINIIHKNDESDSIVLAALHLPLLMWTIFGYIFIGNSIKNHSKKIDFLKFNGDLAVLSAALGLAGGIFSAATIGLFELINIKIQDFYVNYILVWGMPAIPILGTFLIFNNPQIVSKISPAIAKIFTPIVLIMLTIFLIAVINSGKNPYQDREFLLIFNVILIAVMALIIFSLSGISDTNRQKISLYFISALAFLTILNNFVALSAILFRLSEYGFSPNRVVVLGGNILILTNLLLVTYKLVLVIIGKKEIKDVELVISKYLPVYTIWTALVVFLLPLIFNFA